MENRDKQRFQSVKWKRYTKHILQICLQITPALIYVSVSASVHTRDTLNYICIRIIIRICNILVQTVASEQSLMDRNFQNR